MAKNQEQKKQKYVISEVKQGTQDMTKYTQWEQGANNIPCNLLDTMTCMQQISVHILRKL